jgi:NADH-quinone oxidoreductase subunit L
MPSFETLAVLLLATPLTAALLIAFFFRRAGGVAQVLSVGAALAIAAIAGHLIFRSDGDIAVSVPWLELGAFQLSLGFLINDLAKLMLAVVAFVGLLIHIFSLGYMHGDKHVGRFFGCMSFFMFSMLGITIADDLVVLFIFWELVGVSSYLLIGFYFDRPSAVAAANKAFIVNRLGDFGFVIGIAWAYWQFGTVDLAAIGELLRADPQLAVTGIALLLFCGAVGKSGQMPLHVWLPDAMEGPTPVSALIHAATMVAAGIYLLCRISVMMTADALDTVLIVGVATALYAGFCAITQKDIKKILAYSTVSQLGYMVSAFALGSMVALKSGGSLPLAGVTAGVAAAMFHLTTHAFFKALLFLGAGSVIHSCHHEQNIFKMGGLWMKMPITFITFAIGYLALIGFPFASGFFSKDAILYLASEVSTPVYWLLVGGALMTVIYMTRLVIIVFLGRPKSDAADMAHESPWVMWIPLVILAVLAAAGGFVALYPQPLATFLHHVPEAEGSAHTTLLVTSSILVAVGILLAWLYYKPGAASDRLEENARPVYRFLAARLWFDDIFGWYVAKVQQRLALFFEFLEHFLVAGLFVRGSAALAGLVGMAARGSVTGNIQAYAYWFFGGLVALWLLIIGW